MLFNSFEFLIFFPIVTIAYYLSPHRFRWILLLLASCVFYMFFVPIYILILLITILIDYFAAIYISKATSERRRKTCLVLSILSTCIVLIIFKYFNFFNDNIRLLAEAAHWHYPVNPLKILLPIGLSFHTFQSLSYVIEVYRNKQKAEKHFGIYALYVMFYPQLVAGPIERPQNMLHQFYEKHEFDYSNVVEGLKRMLWGYFKKVVIADRLSIYVAAINSNYKHHNGTSLTLAAIFFGFQIYCDFSAYSDIAIGSARVMGFKLMTNFNLPFFSRNVTEFWRRWHISLSTWFNDYLFTPLSFNFRYWGTTGILLAIMITFFTSGLWHGAGWTFILFGVFHGLAVCYETLTKKFRKKAAKAIPRIIYTNLSILFTFTFACFTWIFFRATSMEQADTIIKRILFVRGPLFLGFSNRDMIYAVVFLLVLLVKEFIEEHKLFNNFSLYHNSNAVIRQLTYYSLIVLIMLFGVFDGSQFIYFQF